jgi:hypothetical protein
VNWREKKKREREREERGTGVFKPGRAARTTAKGLCAMMEIDGNKAVL